MRRIGWIVALISVIAGCGGPKSQHVVEPTATRSPEAEQSSPSPERQVYEEARAGAVQIGALTESISEALAEVRKLADRERGDRRQAFSDAADFLDSAGATIADFAVEPPAFVEFSKDFAAQDERRLQAIEAANDARIDVQSAANTLGDLGPEAAQLSAKATEIIADLEEAITTLGGEIEARESVRREGLPDTAHRV